MLAAITRVQELSLDMNEAQVLAGATVNVARHYDVQMAAKTTDWINLFMVLGTVYGARIVAIRARKAMERGDKAKPVNTPKKAEPEAQAEFSIDPETGAMVMPKGSPLN